ncbi:transcriptional regulator [Asticcacaulis taihuensis]|uniref:transcriptional regulator n=1 Tax=Asticcacaulis taihuensis TaxID=260084 RepID=UPI0026ED1072|nr:Cro/CI family transcriptional regulator [Asticcacaulis taihuensis]
MSNGGLEFTGKEAAVRAAGGHRALARKLGISQASVSGWRQVPEDRVFEIERVTGVPAERLRPDLVSSIRITRQGQMLAKARERSGLIGFSARAQGARTGGKKPFDIFDLGIVAAAVRFAASARDLHGPAVMHGEGPEERSARAYGMALAHVVGRVSSTVVAQVLGSTRQNVENAAERYLRARDGDDPDDVQGSWEAGYVIERGRRRRPKSGDEQLWADEQRFLEWLTGPE